MFTVVSESVEDDTALRNAYRVKCARTSVGIIIATFNWVVCVKHLADDDICAFDEIVAREVRNAVLFEPQHAEADKGEA